MDISGWKEEVEALYETLDERGKSIFNMTRTPDQLLIEEAEKRCGMYLSEEGGNPWHDKSGNFSSEERLASGQKGNTGSSSIPNKDDQKSVKAGGKRGTYVLMRVSTCGRKSRKYRCWDGKKMESLADDLKALLEGK